MPQRPTYLDQDTIRLLDDARGQQLLDDAVSAVRAPSLLDQAIKGIRRTAYGDENATSWAPLPIIVSDRPDARRIAEQQQAQAQPSARARFGARETAPATPETPPTPETPDVPTFRAEDFSHEDGQSTYAPSTPSTPSTPPTAASGAPAAMPQGQPSSGYVPSSGKGAEGVERWHDLVAEAARTYNLPEATIKGLMEIESGGNPEAVSSAGAQGLMQVMPFHFGAGENQRDPRTNIMKGAKVYADALARFGDPDKAAAAYFGAIDGQGNVTSATDGSSVDGHAYVRMWRAAASKYGGSTPNAGATVPASTAPAAAAPPSPSAAGAPSASRRSIAEEPQVTIKMPEGGTLQVPASMVGEGPGKYAPSKGFVVVSGDAQKTGADLPESDMSAGDQKRQKLAAAQGDMQRQPLYPTDPEASTGQDVPPEASTYNDPTAGGTQAQPIVAPPTTYGSSGDDAPNETLNNSQNNPTPSYTFANGGDPTPNGSWQPVGVRPTRPQPIDAEITDGGPPTESAQYTEVPIRPARPQPIDAQIVNGGEPTPSAQYTEMPIKPLAQQQNDNAPVYAEQGMPGVPSIPGLQPILDTGGKVLGWIKDTAQAAGDQISANMNQNRRNVEQANAATGYGQVSSTPGEPDYVPQPESPFQMAARLKDDYLPGAEGLTRDYDRLRQIEQFAAQETGQSGLRATAGGGAVNDPAFRAKWPWLAQEYDELQRQAMMTVGGQVGDVKAASKAADAARVPDLGSRIRGALDANAERVAGADARMAAEGSVRAPGTLGIAMGTDAQGAVRGRVIPPDVADTLDFPIRIPEDPAVIRAIEAAGGSVDPNRGVNLNVIRYQGPEAHGRPATRSSTFYTADKPGASSPYAAGKGAQVGGTDRIEAPTTYRSPMVLNDPPGDNKGFDEGIRQLGATVPHPPSRIAGYETRLRDAERQLADVQARQPGDPGYGPQWVRSAEQYVEQARTELAAARTAQLPVTARDIDDGIAAARRAGPPGSPERAQALKDLVRKYGGDEGVIDDLLSVRGADDSESAWAIKENILAHNARAKGYDGVLTVQVDHAGYQTALEKAVKAHPDWQAANTALDEASQAAERAYDAHDATYQRLIPSQFVRSPDESFNAFYERVIKGNPEYDKALARAQDHPEAVRARQVAEDATEAVQQAERKLANVHDRLLDEVDVPPAGKITELADFRESHNPTPGAEQPLAVQTREKHQQALAQAHADWDRWQEQAYAPGHAITPEEMAESRDIMNRIRDAEQGIELLSTAARGEPGYTLRPDIKRRGGSTDATATAGMSPSSGAGIGTRIAADVGSSLGSGTMGAAVGAGLPADTPEERRRNALIGAGAGMVGGPLASRAMRRGEGALATFGASPNYRPPTPQQVQQAAGAGARRGQALNQTVKAPASAVPARVAAVTRSTDDRAALRWTEDMLTDAAGSPRLRENDPARPSTLSRENAGSKANERIDTELAPAIQGAAQAGLQDDLPRFLEDMHHRDVLNEFYNRGHQAVLDRRQPAIDAAKARGAAPAVIQRMEAKAAADADAAGTVAMRRRQGSNAEHAYEATDARLQEQEQRLTADGRFKQLQDAAQAVWDHNAATRQRLVDSGNLDSQVAADLAAKYPHYVPTVPISHLTEGTGPVASSGTAVSRGTKPSISALEDVGTSGERLNPIVASRNSTVKAERDVQRNAIATTFAQMMDDALHASPGTMGTNAATHRTFLGGGTDVHYFANGERQTISVPKAVADGLEAASNMGADPNAAGRIWRTAMGTVTSAMTAGRASFLPVNLLRDVQDYATRTAAKEGGPQHLPGVMGTWMHEAGKAAADIARAQLTGRGMVGAATGAAAGASLGDEDTTLGERVRHGAEGAVAGTFLLGANKVRATGKAAEYLARGGGSGGMSAHWLPGQRWYREIMRDGGAPIKSAGDAARYLGDWLQDAATLQGVKGINERTELISRTAAMTRADKQGVAPTEAMLRGRDASYDPDRSGTVARMLNGWVPFFNASVQNSAQFVRLFKQNPVAATATIAATTAPIMLGLEAWNRSDPTRAQVYDDIPQYVKDSGLVGVLPWAGSDNRGERPNYLWIPTGVQTPFVMAMRGAMKNLPGLEPTAGRAEDWADTLGSVLGMFSPVRGDSVGAAMSNLVPQGIKQGVELAVNRDFYRGNPIETGPADERASAASQAVSGGLNAAGRAVGNDWLQEVRPSGVEHLARALPAYNDIVSGASDMVAPSGYKQAEDRPIANEPFVGGIANRFIRDTGGASLQRAQDARIPEAIRPVLQEADMRPSDIQNVPSRYRGATITRDEQTRWQAATNVYLTEMVYTARDSAAWDDPLKRKAEVQKAMTKARELAARDVFDLTDADARDRMDRERSMSAR